ncbi:hypothetical protein [Rickettsiella endosymbiont of Xylota segnis]|uniref:hypothetical protein n=1 Tax=Rickettsiella endosymbiont of Xylota segnis TaxID=3066238 RepID=UPI0030CBED35
MKQINLLPWREHKNKLKIRRFIIVWFYVSCSCLILIFVTKILIIQQIKHYQLAYQRIYFQMKNISPIVQEIKKIKYKEKQLTKIIQNIKTNRQQVKKILDFISHLKYLITPDIFIHLVAFHPPYLSLIMHANSKKEYVKFKKLLQLKFDSKLQSLILNQFQNLQLDFVVQMILNEN